MDWSGSTAVTEPAIPVSAVVSIPVPAPRSSTFSADTSTPADAAAGARHQRIASSGVVRPVLGAGRRHRAER